MGNRPGVRILDELTLEEYAMLAVGERDGYLDEVLDEYGRRLRWALTGDPAQPSRLDEPARIALIARFVPVLVGLVGRNWIETRETYSGRWHDTSAMSADDLTIALRDPANWLPPPGTRQRGLTITTTACWAAVRQAAEAGRRISPVEQHTTGSA
ncbi:hypothetical protein ACFOX0_28375 [Micromonospora zhanjiangensis]|uniref:Uncharacterized protein n=1 Tax=Micromonospora zhanjiangensis TaxID=1522057 RepID=A0ABV8KUJ1_9ACTN